MLPGSMPAGTCTVIIGGGGGGATATATTGAMACATTAPGGAGAMTWATWAGTAATAAVSATGWATGAMACARARRARVSTPRSQLGHCLPHFMINRHIDASGLRHMALRLQLPRESHLQHGSSGCGHHTTHHRDSGQLGCRRLAEHAVEVLEIRGRCGGVRLDRGHVVGAGAARTDGAAHELQRPAQTGVVIDQVRVLRTPSEEEKSQRWWWESGAAGVHLSVGVWKRHAQPGHLPLQGKNQA
jgi:hypothetical protein